MIRLQTYTKFDLDKENHFPDDNTKDITKTLLNYPGCSFVTFVHRGGKEGDANYYPKINPQDTEIVYRMPSPTTSLRNASCRTVEVILGKACKMPLEGKLDEAHVFPKVKSPPKPRRTPR